MKRHSEIFNYWKDKNITSDGRVTRNNDRAAIPVILSDIAPACWACGSICNKEDRANGKEEVWDGTLSGKEYEAIWDCGSVRSHLNRCHIYAKQFGGSDECDDLFLLCEKCHKESPDTTSPSAFFRWVWRKRENYKNGARKLSAIYKDIEAELNQCGTTLLDVIKQMGPNATLDDFKDYYQQNVGQHGGDVSQSSTIACTVSYLLMKASAGHLGTTG